MYEFTGRLLTRGRMYAAMTDPEQQQWGNDLIDASNAITRLRGEAGLHRELLNISRSVLVEIDADDIYGDEDLVDLINKIAAALKASK